MQGHGISSTTRRRTRLGGKICTDNRCGAHRRSAMPSVHPITEDNSLLFFGPCTKPSQHHFEYSLRNIIKSGGSASNETELTHRWRERGLAFTSSFIIHPSHFNVLRPVVGCIAWVRPASPIRIPAITTSVKNVGQSKERTCRQRVAE